MKFVFNLEYTESFQVLVGKRRDLMANFLVSSLNAEIFLRQDKMERSQSLESSHFVTTLQDFDSVIKRETQTPLSLQMVRGLTDHGHAVHLELILVAMRPTPLSLQMLRSMPLGPWPWPWDSFIVEKKIHIKHSVLASLLPLYIHDHQQKQKNNYLFLHSDDIFLFQ